MADQDKIQELIDASEDVLLQKIIDRQEGALGLKEMAQPGPAPTQAELARWEKALNELDRAASPAKALPKRKRLGRIAVLSILAAAFLLVAASALYRPILNWVESVHEKYTQLQAGETVESQVAKWNSAYVPEEAPEGFCISDAADLGDLKYIEYANTTGDRVTFYQNTPGSNVRIDTEKADRTITPWVDGQTAYLFQKGSLFTLYWNQGDAVLSVEYTAQTISEIAIKAFAENIQWRP